EDARVRTREECGHAEVVTPEVERDDAPAAPRSPHEVAARAPGKLAEEGHGNAANQVRGIALGEPEPEGLGGRPHALHSVRPPNSGIPSLTDEPIDHEEDPCERDKPRSGNNDPRPEDERQRK